MKAVIIIDMIDQFVWGAWANKRAQAIVGNITGVITKAKTEDALVVSVEDHHNTNDPELAIFGEHAMDGTGDAELIPELQPLVDIRLPKRTYDAFFETDLDAVLRANGVTEVILVGVLTDICVRHTAADAFFRGYKVTVVADAVEVLDIGDEAAAELQARELATMKTLYNATILG